MIILLIEKNSPNISQEKETYETEKLILLQTESFNLKKQKHGVCEN